MAHSQNCHRRRRAKVRRIEIRTHLNRSFRHSVGLLPIESSLRQATTFMYLNETILRAETGITPRRPLLIALFQMWTFLLLTLNPRSLLKARNFLIQRSTRAWTSGRNYRRLIARLNLYGLLWSLPLLRFEFFAIFFFWIVFHGLFVISPLCKLQSFHGRQGHLGVCFILSTRVIAKLCFVEIPQQKLQNYLRAFASWHGINANDGNSHISYNTRVESAQKRYAEDGSRIGWTLTMKEVLKTSHNTTRAKWTTQVWADIHQEQ